ncbi:MAG: molybdate ABC transporter substrate-binding protein [Pseudomonadota bacterium]
MERYLSHLLAVSLVLCMCGPARAGDATVAVAANFLTTAEKIAEAYTDASGHKIALAHGSTGRLYAQIRSGAPFDVFLSADAARPARLAEEGRSGSPTTYALGQLVLLVAPDAGLDLAGQRIALADPEIAPYGQAAVEAMGTLGLSNDMVMSLLADSVGQAASIFATGNADAAFVAAALVPDIRRPHDVIAMEGRHAPIRQDAVLLARGVGNPAASGFFAFISSPDAHRIIADAGFGVPE